MNQGIFSMAEITAISNMATLGEAKAAAHAIIVASSAKPENKTKATAMVNGSTSLKKLLLGMSNFSLAFQGLGVKSR